ncbi:MAG: hypothetical protein OEX17_00125 [Rhodospirillaceae bacterium]|nr:hypothetical protein [Rhodospirillaceae bacterium]
MKHSGQKNNIALAVKYLTVALFGIGLSVGLAGCSTTTNDTTLECPEVSILSDGSNLVRFAPGGASVEQNIIHEELFSGFRGSCEHNIDDAVMNVEIIPQIASIKGPANTDGMARFDYFVALSDSRGTIINKQRFPVTITYPDGLDETLWQEEIPVILTLPLKDGESAAKWRVFIGLQLSRDELNYVKARR